MTSNLIFEKIYLFKNLMEGVKIYISSDFKMWEEISDIDFSNSLKMKAYLVVYHDGQIVDGYNLFLPLPDDSYFINDRSNVDKSYLPKFRDILFKSEILKITHTESPFQKFDSHLYKTQITNTSQNSIKINKFSAYKNGIFRMFKSRPKHSTIVNGWYSSLDFKLWYGLKSDWIVPGETVCDFRNYGNNCSWVFEIISTDGTFFWIGSIKD